MLAGVLSTMKEIATKPCYISDDKAALAANVLENFKKIVEYCEMNGGSKFLVGNYVTYVDFIFFELCNLVEFITDGRLINENPVIQRYCQNFMMLPKILVYVAEN